MMALEYDPTVRPHTPARQRDLLNAVYQANAEDETDWLEWKREADLGSKADQFKIAKMMLGLANRTVADSQHTVGGFGYVIVGMEPGTVVGTEQLDAAKVDDGLNRYLGDQGPGWALSYHEIENKNVMLIEVSAPTPGDPIFSLRKAFQPEEKGQGFAAGTVFVRSRTATAPASPEQLEALSRRLVAGTQGPEANIELASEKPVVRLVNIESYRLAMIEAERRRLTGPLPRPAPKVDHDYSWLERAKSEDGTPIGGVALGDLVKFFGYADEPNTSLASAAARARDLSASFGNFEAPWQSQALLGDMVFTEDRDEQEYRSAVNEYLDKLADYSFEYELGQALRDKDELEPAFRVENRSEVNLVELDIDIHLPGKVTGFAPPHRPRSGRPSPPRCWGVAPENHPSRLAESAAHFGRIMPIDIPPLTAADLQPGPTKPAFRNSGSVDLNYFLPHLRPKATDTVVRASVLVAEDDERIEVVADWQATARNVDKVFKGTLSVPVTDLDAMSLLEESLLEDRS